MKVVVTHPIPGPAVEMLEGRGHDVTVGPKKEPYAREELARLVEGAEALPTLHYVIFTDPELAAIGLPEHEAEEQGLEVETATHELKMTRARYKNLKHGLFKLVYERGSRRLVGLHVVAPSASEIVAGCAVAMKLGATVDDLARAHHAYPTFGEGVKAAAEKVPTAVAV